MVRGDGRALGLGRPLRDRASPGAPRAACCTCRSATGGRWPRPCRSLVGEADAPPMMPRPRVSARALRLQAWVPVVEELLLARHAVVPELVLEHLPRRLVFRPVRVGEGVVHEGLAVGAAPAPVGPIDLASAHGHRRPGGALLGPAPRRGRRLPTPPQPPHPSRPQSLRLGRAGRYARGRSRYATTAPPCRPDMAPQ